MEQQHGEGISRHTYLSGLLITVAVLTLPAASRELVWLHSLIPLPVFYYLTTLGRKQGTMLITAALALAGTIIVILGQLPILLFALTLLPVGYFLAMGVQNKETPSRVGFKAVAFLGTLWLLTGLFYAARFGINPYQDILTGLDKGFEQTLAHYQSKAELPPETTKELTATVEMLRRFFAKVFPAIIATSIITTVWMNLVAGHWLLQKMHPALARWPSLKAWRLPEHLIWLTIAAGIALVIDKEPFSVVGLNACFVLGLLYFMQGLAILSHFLARWSMPRFFKGALYALLVIQLYGLVFLALIGLADTWFDFRKITPPKAENHEK